jgi:hypothetical protein
VGFGRLRSWLYPRGNVRETGVGSQWEQHRHKGELP